MSFVASAEDGAGAFEEFIPDEVPANQKAQYYNSLTRMQTEHG